MMQRAESLPAAQQSLLTDLAAGRPEAFATLMRENNRRLWRIARAVLLNESDAEEAVQEAYIRAFGRIRDFRGEANLSTWLSTIVVNEALKLRARRVDSLNIDDVASSLAADHGDRSYPNPEQERVRQELRLMLEQAIDGLAAPFRTVFVLRMIEGLSIEEVATCLGVHSITVRTRLYRAMRQLRGSLGRALAGGFEEAFPFGGARCDRLTGSVLARLGVVSPASDPPAH